MSKALFGEALCSIQSTFTHSQLIPQQPYKADRQGENLVHEAMRPREEKDSSGPTGAGKESAEPPGSGFWIQIQSSVRSISFTFPNTPGLSQKLLSDRTLLRPSRARDLLQCLSNTLKSSQLDDKFNEHLTVCDFMWGPEDSFWSFWH